MNPEQRRIRRRRLARLAALRRATNQVGKGRCPATTKTRFPSFDRAASAALRLSAKLGRGIRTYPCEHCDGWHLTRLRTWKDPE